MVNIVETATSLGCIQIPDNTLIDIEQLKNYEDNQTVIITTGSQGESMAALSRMASNIHKKISIGPGDTVIFSSNPIPGNEKAVTNVINELLKKGADVIFQDVHVSGHACQEEIKLIYTLVQPQYSIPIHGEFKHRKAQADTAVQLGIPKENVSVIGDSGNDAPMFEAFYENSYCMAHSHRLVKQKAKHVVSSVADLEAYLYPSADR